MAWFPCHFVGKPIVALRNIFCFLRLESQSLGATPNKCRPANPHNSAVSLEIFTFLTASAQDKLTVFGEYNSELKCYLAEKQKEIS